MLPQLPENESEAIVYLNPGLFKLYQTLHNNVKIISYTHTKKVNLILNRLHSFLISFKTLIKKLKVHD